MAAAAESSVSDMGSTKYFIVLAFTLLATILVANQVQKKIDS